MIAHRAASAPRAYGVASVDDRSPPPPSDQRYGVCNTALEIRTQVNAERARSIAHVTSRAGSRARGASECEEVGTDLQLVTLVDALAAPSWFDLKRVQAPVVRRAVLEDVVRSAALREQVEGPPWRALRW